MSEGRKDDASKLPFGLLPFDALRGIRAVLEFGARKYAPPQLGARHGLESAVRRLPAPPHGVVGRRARDPETGFSHLWHAGCRIPFLISYEIRGIGRDNCPGADMTG